MKRALRQHFRDLEERAIRILRSEGVGDDRVKLVRSFSMRYRGRAYELTMPYRGRLSDAVEEFHQLHVARYGFDLRGEDVVIVSARLTAYGVIPKPKIGRLEESTNRPKPKQFKLIYFGEAEWVKTPVHWRPDLRPGALVEGPAVIWSDESTVLIPPGFEGFVDGFRALRIRRV